MAPTKGKEAVSFNAIIQRGRDQQKREALANEILGSGRRMSAPGAPAPNRKGVAAGGGSLASRMGVTKRASSAIPKPNINSTRWGHDLHHVNNPRASRVAKLPRTQSASRVERVNRVYNEVRSEQPSSGSYNQGAATKGANDISIRGMGQPTGYTVVASNFAPGTTAADIEAVMIPVGGEMLGCRLTSARPTVIAEMQFVEKSGADNVIAMFNNRKADGRLLYVFMKEGGPSPTMPGQRQNQPSRAPEDNDIMEVDDDVIDRREPERLARRAEPEYQDGRFGFRDTTGRNDYRRDDRRDDRTDRGESRLYSDNMMRNDRVYRR